MANLPNTDFRFIQQEETDAKSSFSEFMLQGVGGDLNYLKKQADDLQTLITNYYANGAISMASLFFGAGQTTVNSPNGKNWVFVMLNYEFNGNTQNHWRPIFPGTTTYYNFDNTGSALGQPKASIAANVVTATGWSHEWYGYGFYFT